MIKAVFFDWFNTLAVYHPPREELQSKALEEFGFIVSPETIRPALLKADKELFEENAVSSMRLKTPEEQTEMYIRYQNTLMTEIGIDVSGDPGIIPRILAKANELYKDLDFMLFDDVIPVMKKLKSQELTTGLITNIESGMKPICDSLGLGPYLDLIVASGEAGSDKPQPEIFLLALERAGVTAEEAVHVGDQYRIDAMGARNAGIKPVIIDRNDIYPDINDVPRIHSLEEIFDYL